MIISTTYIPQYASDQTLPELYRKSSCCYFCFPQSERGIANEKTIYFNQELKILLKRRRRAHTVRGYIVFDIHVIMNVTTISI